MCDYRYMGLFRGEERTRQKWGAPGERRRRSGMHGTSRANRRARAFRLPGGRAETPCSETARGGGGYERTGRSLSFTVAFILC